VKSQALHFFYALVFCSTNIGGLIPFIYFSHQSITAGIFFFLWLFFYTID